MLHRFLKTRWVGVFASLSLVACSGAGSVPVVSSIAAGSALRSNVDSRTALRPEVPGYSVLFVFKNAPGSYANGALPLAGLTASKGVLYGTTSIGGGNCKFGINNDGCGTIFTFSPTSNKQQTISAFANAPLDGNGPRSNLLSFNGKLYGTTYFGGKSSTEVGTLGYGVIYSVDPTSGARLTVYRFMGGTKDGKNPAAGLIAVGGKLYGTTQFGGNSCFQHRNWCGVLYSFDPATGKEAVAFSFTTSSGWGPQASLVNVGKVLYGTTGSGTVFSYDPATGIERTVYSFQGNPQNPVAPLLAINGRLYGTTKTGGIGFGSVFEVNAANGREHTLYSFRGGSDGANPVAGLTVFKGMFFGTTLEGGEGGISPGHGTVFSIKPSSGEEAVLHSFRGGRDGASPYAGLTVVENALYGTTGAQTQERSDGTVFKITP